MKRLLKIKHPVTVLNLNGTPRFIAELAEEDTERNWPAGTVVTSSQILTDIDDVGVGCVIETMNTLYEVVE